MIKKPLDFTYCCVCFIVGGEKKMASNMLAARIENRIFQIRGRKVILDSDLAMLYGVETKYLTRQVRRNMNRFPEDFMFRLSQSEFLRCQNVTSKRGGRRYLPYAFTEEGVAMLSSILNSERAVFVNIQIMRAFAQLRRLLLTNENLRRKIEEMEEKYDVQFKVIFDALKKLLEPTPVKQKRYIGFEPHKKG